MIQNPKNCYLVTELCVGTFNFGSRYIGVHFRMTPLFKCYTVHVALFIIQPNVIIVLI